MPQFPRDPDEMGGLAGMGASPLSLVNLRLAIADAADWGRNTPPVSDTRGWSIRGAPGSCGTGTELCGACPEGLTSAAGSSVSARREEGDMRSPE